MGLTNSDKIKVFIGSSNPSLGKEICENLQVPRAESEVVHFSEGNTMVRILENVRGKDTYIVQGISKPVNDNFVELLFWLDALKMAGAAQVTAVIPFFSYAKGDKKDEPRSSVRAKVTADAIVAAGADNIITMDLHSPQITGFFRRPVDHIQAKNTICEYFTNLKITNLAVASVDVGFAKSAFQYGEKLAVPVIIGNKIRVDHSEKAQIWNIVGEVENKNILIVDDIIFTGESMVAMASELKKLGAKKVFAAVSHAAFTKDALQKIAASSIEEVIITDTIEHDLAYLNPKIKLASVGKSFAKKISSIHFSTPL